MVWQRVEAPGWVSAEFRWTRQTQEDHFAASGYTSAPVQNCQCDWYPLPAATHPTTTDGVLMDLEKRAITAQTRCPCNSPGWPVRKSDGPWRLRVARL